ncbi:TBC1 domain protein [Tritrichomonas foetus]|uniref:TBC1 domain protein n=1 Tax=Tritrichomonas foetus TaxID=1144522 RepID=A0A1J4KCP0_9EUKA|nr:TBC1 domain protein [Tritrichomonas foetus]|eukprot:OHT09185.1 TBC1 domain protein [Tritrichomonas foetus]
MIYHSHQKADFRILPLLQPSPDMLPVDKMEVKRLCFEGLSDAPAEDRAWAWLVLLDVFPPIANDWKYELTSMINHYTAFVNDFHLEKWHQKYLPKMVLKEDIEGEFENKELMREIHADIVRSGRQLQFLPESNEPHPDAPKDDKLALQVENMRRIERLLYIFSSINITFSYMQGFHELLIPLYYVMVVGKDAFISDVDSMDTVEAIVYHAFQRLVTSTAISELYTVRDQASVILLKLGEFQKLFERKLPKLSKLLSDNSIQPLQYAYRWFHLLFSQEHTMLPLLAVWDSIFAHQPKLVEFAYYVGLARIEAIFEMNKINFEEKSDMPKLMSALQNSNVDFMVWKVLKRAQELWVEDESVNSKKNEGKKKKRFFLFK